ncbi:glycosyltransferase family 2 protein [bacterium]|nr:glycosyltransferase family 2 protein [bacterium]
MAQRPWLAVVAPAFNEEDNIEAVVCEWLDVLRADGRPFEIVIANDGSTDRTAEILARLQNAHPELVVVSDEPNHGYGYALSRAIRAASADYIMTMDADGQFEIRHYSELMQALEQKNADIITGYRLGKKDTPVKVFADRMLNLLVRVLFRVSLRDTNCAQKIAKRSILQSITIEAMSYPTPTEITLKAHALGYRVAETGVSHREREAGFSKLHPFRTGIQFFFFLLYLRFRIALFRARIIQTL